MKTKEQAKQEILSALDKAENIEQLDNAFVANIKIVAELFYVKLASRDLAKINRNRYNKRRRVFLDQGVTSED